MAKVIAQSMQIDIRCQRLDAIRPFVANSPDAALKRIQLALNDQPVHARRLSPSIRLM